MLLEVAKSKVKHDQKQRDGEDIYTNSAIFISCWVFAHRKTQLPQSQPIYRYESSRV